MFSVAVAPHLSGLMLPLSGNTHLRGDWQCCLEQVTSWVHYWSGLFSSNQYPSREGKENMFPLCDFTIDETRRISPSWLFCTTRKDWNGRRKQIMVRKRHSHFQTKKQGWIWQSSRGFCPLLPAALRVFTANTFLASFCGLLPFVQFSAGVTLLISLDYIWLCPSINVPQQNTMTWFNTDMSTKPQPEPRIDLSYILRWQHCDIVIMLLPESRYLR